MTLQDALDEGTALFEVLFERATLSVAVLDRDLLLRKFNQAFADSVLRNGVPGAGPAEVGRALHEYFPPEDVLRTMFAPILAGETRWHRGSPHEVDGTMTYWDLLLAPLCRDGEVVGLVEVFTDATERTEAQQRLRRSERRYRSILRNSADIIAVIDAAGVVRYAAPSARRLLALPDDRAVGLPVTTPVHPDDLPPARQWLAECVARPGEHAPFRCRMRHRDGTWHTFEVTPVNLLDDPDVAGIVLNAKDVTERDRVKAELRRRDEILGAVRIAAQLFLESQSSWRTNIQRVMALLGEAGSASRVYIFENFRAKDGSLLTSQSHEWVAPGVEPQIDNEELAALDFVKSGFSVMARRLSAGEVVAGNVADFPASEQAMLSSQDILSLALVPVFVASQWWGFIGFDECKWERDWSEAELDALRAAASTLGAAVQRQRAEDELREQQAQYRQVFEATGDGLVITDLDNRLVRANPAFYQMHGYRPGELAGKAAIAWIHPDFHKLRDEYTAAVLNGEQPRALAVDVRKDGTTFPVQVSGSAFTFQGRPHVLGVVRDDTDRTQAFELLEKRINALSAIAASLTVNQPLTDTMDTIARSAVAATPAIACSVYIQDPEINRLRVYAAAGLPDGYVEAVEQSWRDEPGIADRLGPETEPVVLRFAVERALHTPSRAPLHGMLREVGWDTVAVIPLESQHRRLGSINAYYPGHIDPSPDDLAFLRAVADQCTVAVDNARLLAEAQSKASLEERQRLARELHDSVSQALYGIALGARTAKVLARQAPDQLTEPLDYILSLAQAGMTEMRSLIFELRPESLAQEGLVAALQRRIDVLRGRHHLLVDASLCAEPRIPLAMKETLYRIAQEALHNTVKHAHASQVMLSLHPRAEHIELEISDDGVGFEPTAPRPGHLGLQSMRERANAHQGSFELHTGSRAGTVIRVRLPLPR